MTLSGTNRAHNLFDGHYILKTYRKKILARLPQFKKIIDIEVEGHKSHVWEETYHVVVEYHITFLTKKDKEKKLSIFCSAHSSEPRRNVYESLKFLWKNGFDNKRGNKLTVPQPLFYSKRFRGTFYVGAGGKHLYSFIRKGDKRVMEEVVPMAAAWFAKLHGLPVDSAINFNKDNSRIKTVRPGMSNIFSKIQHSYPQFLETYKKMYEEANGMEKKFLSSTDKRWLIHGDAHPENIIRMSGNKVAAIDFTDLSLSDFARDIGCFLQQLEFKIMRKMGDEKFAEKMKKSFLDSYLKNAKIKMTPELMARIDNYYIWTGLRTVAFFLLKHHPVPDRAEKLLEHLINKK